MYKYDKIETNENGLKSVELIIKIDSAMHSCSICEKGTYNNCTYVISDLSDVANCVKEYVEEYVKR